MAIEERSGGGSNSSPWISVLNVCNTAIGAGVLSFPFAFRQTGLLGGILLTSLAWLIEVGALCLLAWAAEQHKCKTYQELVLTIFGRGMAIFTSLAMLWLCMGVMISYLIIAGDVFEPLFATLFGETSLFADRRFAIIIFALVIALPLFLKRSLKELKWTGLLTVITLAYLAIILVVSGLIHIFTVGISSDVKIFQFNVHVFVSIDIVVFAFQCHIQNVQIFSELSDNPEPLFKKMFFKKDQSSVLEANLLKSTEPKQSERLQRMYEVNIFALLICFVMYSLVGVFGYSMFPYVESDILLSLGTTNMFVYLARIGMALVAILCYPVQGFPARAIVDDAIVYVLNINDEQFSWTRHTILTLILFGATLGTALVITDLGMVFSVLGATGAVTVIFIIPGLILLYTPMRTTIPCNHDDEEALPAVTSTTYEIIHKNWMPILGGALTVFLGFIILVVTLYVTFNGLKH